MSVKLPGHQCTLVCVTVVVLVCVIFSTGTSASTCGDKVKVINVYVSYNNLSQFRVQDTKDAETVAHAMFQNCVNLTGFAYLRINTVNNYTYKLNSSIQVYAAGLAEGHATRELIALHYLNMKNKFCLKKSAKCIALEKFLRKNLDWVIKNVKANPDVDYWYQVRLFYEQMRGLQDGFDGTPGQISMDLENVFGVYLLTILAELPSIQASLSPHGSLNSSYGHCSVLIKVIQEQGKVKDVLMAHDTWTDYNMMLRILKRYEFYLREIPTASEPALGETMTFSSYPGALVSIDDFYVLSSNMVVTETTNPVFSNIFSNIRVESVLESVRVTVANRLAIHGEDWSTTFSEHNSGTYNNQWMVVDLKQYDEFYHTILPGFLTVLEQIPGLVHYADQTAALLNASYWASYNVPYYKDIYDASGFPYMAHTFGDDYKHDYCPRARIFRRDQSKVKDVDSMIHLMRYNDFQHDPLSKCNCTPPYNAFDAISARGDLNLPNGFYPYPQLGFALQGGIDMKLTSISMAMDTLTFLAISGPTYEQQPPFSWSKAPYGNQTLHFGQPDLFKFGPVWFNGTL